MLLTPREPLLPKAGEGEERVIDPEREAHADQHVLGEDRKVVRLRQECHERERDHDRRNGEHERNEARDDRAKDEQQDDERERRAEEELALLQILQRGLVLVGVRDPLAGHRRPVAGLLVEALDDIHHVLDVVLPVPAEGQEKHSRVTVLRDEAPLFAVGDDPFRARRPKLIRELSDSRTRGSRFDLAILGPHDDDLGDRLPARGFLRKALVQDSRGLLRLGRPGDLGLTLEREKHRHQREGDEDDDQPETNHEPRPATTRPSQPLSHRAAPGGRSRITTPLGDAFATMFLIDLAPRSRGWRAKRLPS